MCLHVLCDALVASERLGLWLEQSKIRQFCNRINVLIKFLNIVFDKQLIINVGGEIFILYFFI